MDKFYLFLMHILVLCHHQRTVSGQKERILTVVGSKQIRPNNDYQLSVLAQGFKSPENIRISINGSEANGRIYADSRDVVINGDSAQTVVFNTRNLLDGRYKLEAKSLYDLNFFDESIDLTVNRRRHVALAQVDKPIYKPGDVVNFKIILLDNNLKPLMSKVNIFVLDGDDNVVKEYLNVNTMKGVYQNQLQLSNAPVMGQWKITLKLINNYEDELDDVLQVFEVAEYVYPKYEVNVITKPDVTFSEEVIRVKINAKYENGEDVRGEVTVSAYPILWLGSVQPFIQKYIVRKVTRVENGSSTLEFDIRNELKIIGDYERFVNIEAIFEEDLTGRAQNSSMQVTVHKFNYKLELVKFTDHFKPGLPFYAIAKVRNIDGSPVQDLRNPVKVTPTFLSFETANNDSLNFFLNSNGMAEIEIQVPPKTNHFSLKVQYLNAEFSLGPMDKSKSLSNNFIQLRSFETAPKINNEISMEVFSTEPIDSLTYLVFGKNDLIYSRTLNVPNTNFINFKILTTISMLPYSFVIVYAVRPNGEIMSDKLEINFKNELQNSISFDVPYVNLGPENPISFSVKTKPNSYAGLIAVDEEVAKLNKGNELTIEKVYQELFKKYMKKDSNFIETEPIEGFQNSEAFILTNAKNEKKLYGINRDPVTIRNDDNSEKYSTIRTDIGPAHSFKFKTKPPLAGPYAFSRIPKTRWENPRIYLNKFVKDSWFSEEIVSTGYDGRTTITRKTPPDHPQTWRISGFSVDPIFGLGVNNKLSKIHVTRNFYISTRLPHALKEGELLAVPITAFNNFNSTLKVEIHFHKNDDQFAIVDEKDGTDLPKSSGFSSEKKEMTVLANSQSTISFIIRPKKVGLIKIRANGISNIAVAEIENFIRVDHVGSPRSVTKKYFVNLQRNPEYKLNVTIKVPAFNVVPQSVKVEAAGRRNLVEMALDMLKSSAKMFRQTNCEDNALAIVSNCLILQNSPQLSSDERKTFEEELESRYQSQLSFKRVDGSFSMFGKSDKTGNIWLTALAAKALQLASNFIHIEEKVIAKAFDFLANVQSKDGSFSEFGDVYHSEAEEKNALTALVLTSFLSSGTYEKKNRNSVSKAVDYLVRNMNEINEAYPLAISAYSLQIAKHIARDAFFTKLDSKASVQNDSKHWENGVSEQKNSWYIESNGLNIETTAYALLTLAEGNLYFDAVPVVKWLLEHENHYLGSTKVSRSDVVTLEALLKTLPRITNFSPSNINMNIKYDEATANLMENRNSKYSIPPMTKNVEINANGQGYGIVEITSTFNTNITVGWPRFTLDPQVNRQSTKNFLHLTICTSFIPDNSSTRSNGAIMEVSFPSGFVFDRETIPFLKSTEKIMRVETRNDDTVVDVFFENLENKEICPVFKAFRVHATAVLQPVPVIIYDHFDSSRRALQFYRPIKLYMCDLCTNKDGCEVCAVDTRAQKQVFGDEKGNGNAQEQSLANQNKNSGQRMISNVTTVLVGLLIIVKLFSYNL